jgi:hypothetical protein
MTPDSSKQLAAPTLPSTDTPALTPPVFGSFNAKPKAKSQQATFVGSAATPGKQNLGSKTLLGT